MYNQKIGTAMGTKLAPPYACLAIGFLEVTKLYPELINYFPVEHCDFINDQFLRFMDDGFIPWPKTLDVKIFEMVLNKMDENIKFTLEAACEVEEEDLLPIFDFFRR